MVIGLVGLGDYPAPFYFQPELKLNLFLFGYIKEMSDNCNVR